MSENKIERYLIDLMLSYTEIEKDMWLINDDANSLEGVVVMYAAPIVVVRVVVMPAPKTKTLEFFTKILELNASEVLHGAYALDKNDIILVDTLEYDSMDFGDLRASLESVGLALAQHYPLLSQFRD
jgi:hypothetical protein